MRYKIVFVTLMLLGLLQTVMAQQEPVYYLYHEWTSASGIYKVTNESRSCATYKVLNSSTHTNNGDFGVGDNPLVMVGTGVMRVLTVMMRTDNCLF